MSYVLVGSLTSPYSRKLRIFMHDRVEFSFRVCDYLNNPADSAYLQSISPINKIPVLFDGEQKVFDSRVIYNYLSAHHNWKPLSADAENRLSMIDAANDTAVNIFMLKKGGMDVDASENFYVKRQIERIRTVLQELAPWAATLDPRLPNDWDYPAISLYSFLFWANFRRFLDLNDYPVMKRFVDDFAHAPGVAETTIPA